jgi:hypothetical protein
MNAEMIRDGAFMNRRYYQAGHSETVKADEDTIDRPFE